MTFFLRIERDICFPLYARARYTELSKNYFLAIKIPMTTLIDKLCFEPASGT